MFYDQCLPLLKYLKTKRDGDNGYSEFPDYQLFYINENSWDFLDEDYLMESLKELSKSDGLYKVPCNGFLPYENVALEFENVIYFYSATKNEISGKGWSPDKEIELINLLIVEKKNSRFLSQLRGLINGSLTADKPFEIPLAQYELDGDNAVYLGANVNLDECNFKLGGDFPDHVDNKLAFHFYNYRGLLIISKLINFLSCKNIKVVENEPSKILNKSRVKKGKLPFVSYKTLELSPVGKTKKEHESKGLWTNRVHLCRGHSKEYTADKPLFGRYTGRYWWQPAVRGRNRDGVVMKDYEVKPTA